MPWIRIIAQMMAVKREADRQIIAYLESIENPAEQALEIHEIEQIIKEA